MGQLLLCHFTEEDSPEVLSKPGRPRSNEEIMFECRRIGALATEAEKIIARRENGIKEANFPSALQNAGLLFDRITDLASV